MHSEVLIERFFTALISGNRVASREIVDEVLQADCPAETVLDKLFWPTLEHIQKVYRADQLSELSHHYATRLIHALANQMQLRLKRADRRGKTVLLVSGPESGEEVGAHLTADLLEADGYDVYFAGGGVANDEVVNQLGELSADILVVFGAAPSTVPLTRQLIDRLHSIGACPKLQVVVGGGVFNRADGLAEEIGADLWAKSPMDLVTAVSKKPKKRMTADQRTVGRKRRAVRAA